MTMDMPIAFPSLSKVTIGDYLIESVDARDLHSFMDVGEDFSSWIKERIATYKFLENQDFVCSPNSGSQRGGSNRIDYFVSLDMAKELAMVERNEHGREARRYLIECERRLRNRMERISDIAAIDERVKAILATMFAEHAIAIRYGKTAGQIWDEHGYLPKMKLTNWFSNRLVEYGCAIDGGGYGQLGEARARMFDPDKARRWLKHGGGDHIVRRKILEKQGQGRLNFVKAAA